MADGAASDPPPRALHLSIADALEVTDSVTAHVGRSLADHVTVSDEARPELLRLGPVTIRVSQTWESSFRVHAPREVEPSAAPRVPEVVIALSRDTWLLTTSTAMVTASQILAPGDALVGVLALAVGYAAGLWRWQQQHRRG